ncbi:hypothetical protein [Oribacterium sinus]|uniref:hypothetical protein n=1 Tax=Oribacterium sinus TaxID=237576 RepID=UPI0028E3AFBF|nr:hypothetical protein [Oribacterium sinus]
MAKVVETSVNENATVEAPVEATASANAVNPMEKDTKVVFLPLDDTHKRPLFVCVNGRSLRVPRGKNVEVPKEFAEAIRNSMEQEAEAIRYSDSVAYEAEG